MKGVLFLPNLPALTCGSSLRLVLWTLTTLNHTCHALISFLVDCNVIQLSLNLNRVLFHVQNRVQNCEFRRILEDNSPSLALKTPTSRKFRLQNRSNLSTSWFNVSRTQFWLCVFTVKTAVFFKPKITFVKG